MLVGLLSAFMTQRYPRGSQARRAGALAPVILGGLVALPVVFASAQTRTPADPLASLEPLIGRWEGTSEGEPGKSSVQREYTRILGTRFIHGRNRSVYAPQEKNPKGETHEDIGIFSFDTARQRINIPAG